MNHLDENQILELIACRLPLAERAEADAHLDGCPECREWVAALAKDPEGGGEEHEPSLALEHRPEAPLLRPGDAVDRYRLLQPSAERSGSWLAEDSILHRRVALTLLAPADARDREALLARAHLAAQASHPHLARVHDAGVWRGNVFVVAEAVLGQPLARWLATEPDAAALTAVFADLARALAAAHRLGCSHGAFDEGSVWVEAEGNARVVDLGQREGTAASTAADDERAFARCFQRALAARRVRGLRGLWQRIPRRLCETTSLAGAAAAIDGWAARRRGRRRWAAGITVLASLGGLVAAAAMGSTVSCAVARPVLGADWAARRGALREALAAREGVAAAEGALAALERGAEQTAAAAEDACRASPVFARSRGRTLNVEPCFKAQLRAWELLAGALTRGDAPTAPAAEAVRAVAQQSGCDARLVEIPPADVPEALLEARVELALGRYQELENRARALLGHPERFVAAEARWDLACAHSRLNVAGSARELEDAAWWAEAARRSDLAALAWLELTRFEQAQGRASEAERALRQAQAAVERTQDPASLAVLQRMAGELREQRP